MWYVGFSGCATARKSVVKSVTVGWKRCVAYGHAMLTGLVDPERVATWKVDHGTKKVGHHWLIGTACFAYDKTVKNQRKVKKSAFENQLEKNSVWIIKWTTLLGIFCKISFTPTVTSCYQVHADARLSAALLCYSGVTGVEASLLLTVYCIE